jgi:hypothetical protein
MKKLIIAVTVLLMACATQASFITDWVNWSGVTTITDGTDGVVADYRDITAINHYYDGSTYHYFRMLLEGGSGTAVIGGATDYMINIDSVTGGQSSGTSLYVATSLTGIDQIFDSHVANATLFSSASGGHNHISSDGANGVLINFTIDGFSGAAAGNDFQGGTSYLEWKVNESMLPENSFTIYGSSLSLGVTTFDVTDGVSVIPEPASALMLMFGAGVSMAIYRARRWANR